jgi:hypothetical protein
MNNLTYNLNTNLDEYTDDELLTLLELEEPSMQDITNKIEFLVSNYFNEDNKLVQFFYAIQNRLLNRFNNESFYLRDDIFQNGYNIETENRLFETNNEQTDNEQTDNEQTDNEQTDNEQTDNEQTDNEETDNEQTDNEEIINNIEGFSNLENTNINNTTNNNTTNNNNTSSNKFEFPEIKKDKNVIENYSVINFLHFNTIFRDKNNPLLETHIPATDSKFLLSTPINNISEIRLASINMKKPYLISESKLNNKFIIKKYVKTINKEINIINNEFIDVVKIVCDFSKTIIIEDGYYEEEKSLEKYLNETYFYLSIDTNYFMKNLKFSINENSKKILFEYDSTNITSDLSFHHFSLDFKTHYTPYYSLATILGFDLYKNNDYYTSINELSNNYLNNVKIISNYVYSNIGNRELYFCFDEYQSNIIETHKLFLNNNMSTNKILAKINATLGNKDNNYYINELFSINNIRFDNIRKYDGTINLLNFNIKIIDYYGNIVNANINEDFTFTLEVKIENTRLIKE